MARNNTTSKQPTPCLGEISEAGSSPLTGYDGIQLLDELMQLARPLSKEELCQFLGINRNTLEYYNGQGLPRFKLGNQIRYITVDVLNYFRERGIQQLKERFAYEPET